MEWNGYGTLYEMYTNLSMDHHGIINVALALNRAIVLSNSEGCLILLIKFSTVIRRCYFDFYGVTCLLKNVKNIRNRNNSVSSFIGG
uniref:Uncharacterized protein n=1 Tax=Panagrolaimus sp. PS1159 TaxID=55785 RepID=A0AC35FJ29_9BILA